MTPPLRRTRAWIVTVASTLALILAATPAAADPEDDQARVERELEQARVALEASSARVEAAGAALLEADAKLPGARQRLSAARAARAQATRRAEEAQRGVDEAEAHLDAADQALAAAVRRLEQSQGEVAALAASAYMGRDVAGIDAMLQLESPGDFVASLTYLSFVGEDRQEILDRHAQARSEAASRQNVQLGYKREADAAMGEADKALAEAVAAEAKAGRAERGVADIVAQRERALQVAEEERQATEQRYRELQAESDRIAADIRALANGDGPVLSSGQRLAMPVAGTKTSDFGNRLDPIYGVWRLHAGVDFAAPGGTPIWAAAAGSVFRAGWNGGYGNYTCIYHGTQDGKGVATCYAHQSAIMVSVGDDVTRGQVIGRVGTTGDSTGNHLHFEVRLDGTPVDPLPWLPSCLC